MIGVGIAWASILSMPYAILAGSISPMKMGVYMGIFNFFIVIPQIINALIGGPLNMYTMTMPYLHWLPVAFLDCCNFSSKSKDVDDVIKTIMNTKAFIFDLDG
jgi:maltose/moltooligosaccharide transporter